MPEQNPFTGFGHIDGASIADILRFHSALLPRYEAAVIRTLDSDSAGPGIADFLQRSGIDASERDGYAVVAPAALIAAASRDDVFCGFDELWLLEDLVHPLQIGNDSFAIFRADFSESVPPPVVRDMLASGCNLLLGDGVGLNYCTTWAATADRLMEEFPQGRHGRVPRRGQEEPND